MARADEQKLLVQAIGGNAEAFGKIVRRYQSAVNNVAYRTGGHRRDAEDAAQESFLRCYGALQQFDMDRPFGPWIKRITLNVCLNMLESSRVKPQISVSDLEKDDGENSGINRWSNSDPSPGKSYMLLVATCFAPIAGWFALVPLVAIEGLGCGNVALVNRATLPESPISRKELGPN